MKLSWWICTLLGTLALLIGIASTVLPHWFLVVEEYQFSSSSNSDSDRVVAITYFGLFKRCSNSTEVAYFCVPYNDRFPRLKLSAYRSVYEANSFQGLPDFLLTAQAFLIFSNVVMGASVGLTIFSGVCVKVKRQLKMCASIASFVAGILCITGTSFVAARGLAYFRWQKDEIEPKTTTTPYPWYRPTTSVNEYRFEYSLHAAFGLGILSAVISFVSGLFSLFFACRDKRIRNQSSRNQNTANTQIMLQTTTATPEGGMMNPAYSHTNGISTRNAPYLNLSYPVGAGNGRVNDGGSNPPPYNPAST